MLLYHRHDNVSSVDGPEGHFTPGADGGFALPDTMFEQLHKSGTGGERLWETQLERQQRTHREDLERRRDPAVLYDAVGDFTSALEALAARSGAAVPDGRDAEIAELRKQLAELQAAQAPAPAGDGESGPEKPARRKAAGGAPSG